MINNKMIFSFGIILLFIGMNISSSTGFDLETKSTKPIDGKTLYVGGSGPGNYTKIQDAIDNASDGDTVFVYKGTYWVEELNINKSINLIGQNRNNTIINGYWIPIIFTANWINFSGFTIRNGLGGYGLYIKSNYTNISGNIINYNDIGVYLYYASHNIITNNIITNNYDDGISLIESSKNIIKHNNITNQDNGIRLGENTSHNVITENYISHNEIGINSHGHICRNNTITGNEIISNIYGGIEIRHYDGNTISNNIVSLSEIGIVISISNDNIVKNNIITNNEWSGLTLAGSNNNIVTDNTISDNGDGIVGGGEYNTIKRNNIHSNFRTGLNISDGIFFNDIYHNIFISNNENAIDNGKNSWDDGYPSGGNYWDDYVGNDSDGDGIGDIPHNISGGINQDRYPLGYFDTKPPKISIEWEAYKSGCYWYVDFRINASDAQGDMDRIEVFINDGLQEIITGTGPDYVFTIQWSKSLRSCVIYFYCYDRAGNVAILSVNGSDIESYPYSYNMFFSKWLDRFPIINQLITRIIERWII